MLYYVYCIGLSHTGGEDSPRPSLEELQSKNTNFTSNCVFENTEGRLFFTCFTNWCLELCRVNLKAIGVISSVRASTTWLARPTESNHKMERVSPSPKLTQMLPPKKGWPGQQHFDSMYCTPHLPHRPIVTHASMTTSRTSVVQDLCVKVSA